MLSAGIKRLVQYGIDTGLMPKCERIYATNLLLNLFHEDTYDDGDEDGGDGGEVERDNEDGGEVAFESGDRVQDRPDVGAGVTEQAAGGGMINHARDDGEVKGGDGADDSNLEDILAYLLDEAVRRGIISDDITSRDLFDAKLMNTLMPRPATVREKFSKAYEISPERATDYFYKLSRDSDYIRRYRIVKDRKWKISGEYGDIDITINLSKPEKDPKAIAAAGRAKSGGYPKCLLCAENEGYAGRADHPARDNHRVILLTLDNEPWGFQYSPYVYYNEHCIVFNTKHIPMRIERETFVKLLDFVRQFPHYILGSNADLPIVGGSILSHDHYQGGRYEFAMAKARIEENFYVKGYEDVSAGIVKWPLSVIRLRSKDADRIIDLAAHILDVWRGYTDKEAFIFAETAGERHNTVTPIARKVRGAYELDMALRNNITTDEHPFGVYHPHTKRHNIKKENIGLIEVMGLAVLPARLKSEMDKLAGYLIKGADADEIKADASVAKHADWALSFVNDYARIDKDNVMDILEREIGITFTRVLEDCGVFKRTTKGRAAFHRFLEAL